VVSPTAGRTTSSAGLSTCCSRKADRAAFEMTVQPACRQEVLSAPHPARPAAPSHRGRRGRRKPDDADFVDTVSMPEAASVADGIVVVKVCSASPTPNSPIDSRPAVQTPGLTGQ
jgi:hypothetical protein